MGDLGSWIILSLGFIGGYFLYKLFKLYFADADLVTSRQSLRPQYFKDKVVWVTGASSGIGAEMCVQLSKMDAKLVMSARNKEKMEEIRKNLAHPDLAKILPVDLSNPDETRTATEKAKKLFGRIDILVNNAGVSTRAMFVDVQEQVHRRVMEVDFFSAWILTHDTLPGMVENKFGHIINISSIWGKAGPTNRSSYSSAKFAIVGLMDCIRNEMLCSNVSVTNVFPGPVVTMAGANALTGDGTAVGKNDSLVASGMSTKRCVELTLMGVSNKLNEVWVSPQPYLMYPYFAHYCPSLLKYMIEKRARVEIKAAKKRD